MIILDVNVLVHAHRRDSPDHDRVLAWLADRSPYDDVRVPAGVVAGFLRVVTHPRVHVEPSSPADAVAFVTWLLAQPGITGLEPGPEHWPLLARFITDLGLRGNDIPDAALAALAVANGARLASLDRGFSRFPGLTVELPVA